MTTKMVEITASEAIEIIEFAEKVAENPQKTHWGPRIILTSPNGNKTGVWLKWAHEEDEYRLSLIGEDFPIKLDIIEKKNIENLDLKKVIIERLDTYSYIRI